MLQPQHRSAPAVVEHLVGMQAQNPTDPYYALHARLADFRPSELEALLTARSAVRTSVMRGTIHLVTAADALLLSSLMRPVLAAGLQSAFRRRLEGVDRDDVAAFGRDALHARPMTARELKRLVAERWPQHDAEALTYVVRYLVPLVQVPPRGLWYVDRQPAPVLAIVEDWLGEPTTLDPSPDDVVLRYLAAFGPASNADVGTWSRVTGVAEIIDRLRSRLRTFVDESGRELFDVVDGSLPDPDVPAPPRFLPEFDNVFLSHHDRSRIVDPSVRLTPLTTQRSVRKLLIDGFLTAEWAVATVDDVVRLTVRPYRRLSSGEEAAVAAEAAHLVALEAPDHVLQLDVEPMY